MDNDTDVQHIFPVDDLFPHKLYDWGIACECSPNLDMDGDNHVIVIHNAFDRREVWERLRLLWPTYEGFPHG